MVDDLGQIRQGPCGVHRQFVDGTTQLAVPNTEPGVLEFSDRSGKPLFTVTTTPVQ
ncbi:hypothetical protein [Kitasatospora sp. NPDC085879]|uniref:hypothetical protein n=1 Tax=Kitasatospora sp. NPDC085879 TaxID=3154769 RepID=UPI003430C2D3